MRVLTILFTLFHSIFVLGQFKTLPVFPEDWFGKWCGNLEVYNKHQVLAQTVPMSFECFPTDSLNIYKWNITYGTDTLTGKRQYNLIKTDNDHYHIDENNGILIDGFLFGHKFISRFEVMENQLTAIYERSDDLLIFEIIVNKATESRVTGGITADNGEVIPTVKSYPVNGYQRAILTKIR